LLTTKKAVASGNLELENSERPACRDAGREEMNRLIAHIRKIK